MSASSSPFRDRFPSATKRTQRPPSQALRTERGAKLARASLALTDRGLLRRVRRALGTGGPGRVPRLSDATPIDREESGERPPGGRDTLIALGVYLAALSAATFPVVLRFGRSLPAGWVDAYQALWVMRWNREHLLQGRLPGLIAEPIHRPTGAPLGLFSPLQLQSLLFVPLATAFGDLTCYSLIWVFSLLATGLGTAFLAWWAVRDRRASLVAGLLAMLSGPVLLQAHGALELTQLGGLAVFLISWIRFVDRPSRGRLAVAIGLYVLVAMTAAYFAVFAMFPAALYVATSVGKAGRGGWKSWTRPRVVPLLIFATMAAAALGVLFSGQIWAEANGFAMPRSRDQFHQFRAPAWAFLVPTPLHRLGALVPREVNALPSIHPVGYSYLGVVSVVFAAVALLGKRAVSPSGVLVALPRDARGPLGRR